MSKFMIYGANGYTGRLTAMEARNRGFSPILAGRRADAIGPLANELGLESRIFNLDDTEAATRSLEGVSALLLCAGPFSATSRPALAACMRAGTHYLDITGEISVFEDIHSRSAEVRSAGIVAMPGVGFDVVPSDCLAAMLKRELQDATHLRLAFRSRYGKLSPGTTKTMIEGLPEGGKVRRNGVITRVPPAWKVEEIEFVPGEKSLAVTIPWGDVSTAFYSTGIPNIEVFIGTNPRQVGQMRMTRWLAPVLRFGIVQKILKANVDKSVRGPTDDQRARDNMFLYGEVSNGSGKKVIMRMRTQEGYTFTADASLCAVARLLDGGLAPGAYTASMAFGPDFVLGMKDVCVTRE